jgi:hypothetical protein
MMMNFMLFKDDLFENVSQNWLLPYTYVKREFKLDNAQVSELLGDLIVAGKIKTASMAVGYVVGGILILGAAYLFYLMWKARNDESLKPFVLSDEEGDASEHGEEAASVHDTLEEAKEYESKKEPMLPFRNSAFEKTREESEYARSREILAEDMN